MVLLPNSNFLGRTSSGHQTRMLKSAWVLGFSAFTGVLAHDEKHKHGNHHKHKTSTSSSSFTTTTSSDNPRQDHMDGHSISSKMSNEGTPTTFSLLQLGESATAKAKGKAGSGNVKEMDPGDVVIKVIGPGDAAQDEIAVEILQALMPGPMHGAQGSNGGGGVVVGDAQRGDPMQAMRRDLDLSIAMGLMPIIQAMGKPPVHPCDPILEKVCPGIPRNRVHDSIHCLATHPEQVSKECEQRVHNSLSYLCHKELETLCDERKTDPFDISPLQCLRVAMEQDARQVSEQCTNAMQITHRIMNTLNTPGAKITLEHKDAAKAAEEGPLHVVDPQTGHTMSSLASVAQWQKTVLFPVVGALLLTIMVGALLGRSAVVRQAAREHLESARMAVKSYFVPTRSYTSDSGQENLNDFGLEPGCKDPQMRRVHLNTAAIEISPESSPMHVTTGAQMLADPLVGTEPAAVVSLNGVGNAAGHKYAGHGDLATSSVRGGANSAV
ncbi:unnamed protein product [Amoebophrya sp. A25]|nr:unnamed protein product [Amoebophrya sp. A25]|eukprot:GSA25T00012002001.1